MGGCGTACSDLMSVAAETFVKEQLSDLFRRVRSNGPQYIKTSKFRRKLNKEEEAYDRGEVQRTAYGLLPVETEVESQRRPFNREDLRLAALMGNSFISQSRIIHEKIISAPFVEEEYDEDDDDVHLKNGTRVNGFARGDVMDGVQKEETEWGWSGGNWGELKELDGELDDVLAIG